MQPHYEALSKPKQRVTNRNLERSPDAILKKAARLGLKIKASGRKMIGRQ
jgi:hypothetical protein